MDSDSDECNGNIILKLSVSYGLISIPTVTEPGVEALSPSVVDIVHFYAEASCQDGECMSKRNVDDCNAMNQCDFDFRANQCRCKITKPGRRCSRYSSSPRHHKLPLYVIVCLLHFFFASTSSTHSVSLFLHNQACLYTSEWRTCSLKMRGPQQDVASALKAVVYKPYTNTNYLLHATSSLEGEVLRIEVSDHKDPENALDEGVFCGNVPQLMSAWQVRHVFAQHLLITCDVLTSSPCI